MDQLLQHLLNALILGGTYALLGIGLTLIFGIMRVVNFAHGELYAFGAETTERIRQRIVDTTPLKAASKPEDIADAGLFLISDAARHITGETLMVDAGLHLGSPPQSALRR